MQDRNQVIRRYAGAPRAIDRRHDSFVQHIHVEVNPEPLIRLSRQHGGDARSNAFYPNGGCLKYVDRINGGMLHVGPREVRILALALTKLDHVAICYERAFDTRPFCSQRLTTPRYQSKVHTRRSTQSLIEVVVTRMPEIAMAVDVDQSDWPLAACASERPHEYRAVATDDEGKLASTPYIADGISQR